LLFLCHRQVAEALCLSIVLQAGVDAFDYLDVHILLQEEVGSLAAGIAQVGDEVQNWDISDVNGVRLLDDLSYTRHQIFAFHHDLNIWIISIVGDTSREQHNNVVIDFVVVDPVSDSLFIINLLAVTHEPNRHVSFNNH
jgi:hypothetical protein